jgi:membrane dipeptidase
VLAGLLPLLLWAAPAAGQDRSEAALLARARRLHRASPLVDGHNDLPWEIRNKGGSDLARMSPDRGLPAQHTDVPRLRRGGVGGVFWAAYVPTTAIGNGAARFALEQIDLIRRMAAASPALELARTAADVERIHRAGRVAALIGIEGGHAIENSLGALRAYYDMGARYMTLTHNVTLDWADAALDEPKHGGLTEFGKEVVREMNRMGMLVDLSHVSPGTMSDALDVTEAPVIFSHSGSRELVDHKRNIPDSILARLPKNGGVVMVPFVTVFVSRAVKANDDTLQAQVASARRRHGADTAAARAETTRWQAAHPRPKATVAEVADQVEHVRRIAGVDHVGIGGDFDGISENVVGLEDVSTYPTLFAELAHRGWSDADLAKLASGNVLRVLTEAERVATRLKRARGPSQATIEKLDGRAAAPRAAQ